MHCSKCGAELAPEDRFCGECGVARPQLSPRFAEAEHRFAALRAHYQAGELDDAAHVELLKVLSSGNAKQAEQIMFERIQDVRKRNIEYLKRLQLLDE